LEHIYHQRVYYSDTDAGKIMYHGRYLDFAEHARTEFVRAVTSSIEQETAYLEAKEVGFVVKSIEITYHTPAFLDDLLTVKSSILSLKRFSITLRQSIFRDEVEIATLTVKAAAVDLQHYTIRPLESWFAQALKEYQITT
jgi:acyl-CoA thioester hydrolase